jgi:hypothetical protein
MIDSGAIKLIVKMLESQDNNLRRSTVDALNRMAKHGVIIHPCVTGELTNSTQKTSRVLWLKRGLSS